MSGSKVAAFIAGGIFGAVCAKFGKYQISVSSSDYVNVKGNSSSIVTMNGVTYTGKNIRIDDNGVVIDGEKRESFNQDYKNLTFNVTVEGNPLLIETMGSVTVNGNCGGVNTMGTVNVTGDSGNINTMGAVKVSGNSGTISTMGNVTR
jgi:hypothetical protein